LNFEFLKSLSSEEAAKFFQDLLWKLGDSFNDGRFDRLVEHIYEWQIRGYAGEGRWTYDQGPFSPLQKPISELRLALLTSSGHFVEGDDPNPFGVENMTQEEAIRRIDDFTKAVPELSAIPFDTPTERLRVRHGGVDIRGAQADPNVALPLQIVLELEKEGYIGELAPEAYSFAGACSQMRLLKQAGPQWIEKFQRQQIDAALLVPV
jgi:hypothetical protein